MREELVTRHLGQRLGQEAKLNFAGEFNLLLLRFAGEHRLVHPRVRDRDAREIGNNRQQIQIVGNELLRSILRVELNRAQRPSLGRGERNAHHRTDLEFGDARGRAERRVARRVFAQIRFHLVDCLPDDRPAESCIVLLRAAIFHDLGNRPTGLVEHDHETPVGVAEDAEEGIRDLRQQWVQLERLR